MNLHFATFKVFEIHECTLAVSGSMAMIIDRLVRFLIICARKKKTILMIPFGDFRKSFSLVHLKFAGDAANGKGEMI